MKLLIILFTGFFLSSSLIWADETKQVCEDSSLIFTGDFESGNFLGFTDSPWRLEHTLSKIQIAIDPVRQGKYAAKFYLDRIRHKDMTNYRTDMLTATEGGDYLRLDIGKEYWYGFSVFLSEAWKPDTQSELFAQWHATPDQGEEKRSPPLAIYIYGEDYTIKKRWDSNPVSNKNKIPHKILWVDKIEPDNGRWVDRVFHVKWLFNDDGFIEVWKDGMKILSEKGPNCYNDEKGLYFRFGVYK